MICRMEWPAQRRCALVLMALALLVGCERGRPEVVAYVSVDEHAARPVLALFTERTGISVRALYDSEINKTTGLTSRLRNERLAPRADLFWSGESVQAGTLAREGVLSIDEQGLTPTMIRARVVVYDPARTSTEDLPRTWWDLADERFLDRIAMADPRFGSTSGHMAALYAWCEQRGEPARFEAWARGLERNRVKRLTSGNAGVVRAVAAGEAAFGMTDTDDVAAFVAQPGAQQLGVLILRHGEDEGEGPWLVTGVAALVAGGPNHQDAERLLQFLSSSEAQTLLASVAPGFHPVHAAESLGLVDSLRVDAALAEQSLPKALEVLLATDAR